MKRSRSVKPGQVWEFPGDEWTTEYGMCLVLRPSVDPHLDPGAHECFMLFDPGDNWGDGKVVTLWLSGSSWDPLEA